MFSGKTTSELFQDKNLGDCFQNRTHRDLLGCTSAGGGEVLDQVILSNRWRSRHSRNE